MKSYRCQWVVVFWVLLNIHASATVLYVDLNSANPTPPFTNWATAATNIQDAVDAASAGDTILVTNGIYQTGGRVVYGATTNRVAVNKPVTVQSVNGPAVTIIQGHQVFGYICGDSAVRCVYLTNNTVLIGFTLSGGATRNSGDTGKEQSGGSIWCEDSSATVSNCIINGNYAYIDGGGIINGTINNSTIIGNAASKKGNYYGTGGGAKGSILNNCVITGNNAFTGGGVSGGTLYQCIINNNSVTAIITFQNPYDYYFTYGGGLYQCSATQCKIFNNSAMGYGGGFYAYDSSSTLNNCLVVGNSAIEGGGAEGGILNNCTLVSNSGGSRGAGAMFTTLNNCIAYYNSSADCYGSALNYCCTRLLPTNGVGNFTNAPVFVNQVAGNYRLQSNSPCINAGNNAYVVSSTDLDGRPRIAGGTVDTGTYEFQGAGMGEFIGWLQQYGLPTDGSADYADPDGDGMNNWQEWRTGTNPNNAASVLKMASASATNNPPGLVVTWQSVIEINYLLQRATIWQHHPLSPPSKATLLVKPAQPVTRTPRPRTPARISIASACSDGVVEG